MEKIQPFFSYGFHVPISGFRDRFLKCQQYIGTLENILCIYEYMYIYIYIVQQLTFFAKKKWCNSSTTCTNQTHGLSDVFNPCNLLISSPHLKWDMNLVFSTKNKGRITTQKHRIETKTKIHIIPKYDYDYASSISIQSATGMVLHGY